MEGDLSHRSGRIRSEGDRITCRSLGSLRQDTQAPWIREISPIRPETSQAEFSFGKSPLSLRPEADFFPVWEDSVRRRSGWFLACSEPSTGHPGPTDPRDQPHPTRNQPGRFQSRRRCCFVRWKATYLIARAGFGPKAIESLVALLGAFDKTPRPHRSERSAPSDQKPARQNVLPKIPTQSAGPAARGAKRGAEQKKGNVLPTACCFSSI